LHAGQSAAPPRSHCARARGRAGPGSGRTPHRPAGGPRPASTTVVAVSPAVGRLRTGRVGADSDTSRHCRGPLRRLPSRNPAGTVVLVILEFSSQKFFGFRFRSIPQAGLGSFHLWIRVSSPRLEPHIPTDYLSSPPASIFQLLQLLPWQPNQFLSFADKDGSTVTSAAVGRPPERPAWRCCFAPGGDRALPPARRRAPAGHPPRQGCAP
jgi:hypothetical protein